jgi:hypothetical protein
MRTIGLSELRGLIREWRAQAFAGDASAGETASRQPREPSMVDAAMLDREMERERAEIMARLWAVPNRIAARTPALSPDVVAALEREVEAIADEVWPPRRRPATD